MEFNTKPVKWTEDRPRQAYELALLGISEKRMAAVMGVDVATIEYWKTHKPEFVKMLNAGRDEASGKVAYALFRNAIEYEYFEDQVFVDKTGVPHKVTLKKHHKGDVMAEKAWLAAKERGVWGENSKIDITQTNININKLDLSSLTKEQLALVEAIQMKQLTINAGHDN